MDDNPTISLFQAGSINVENALQNQEEEEDLEEQKRRDEEIKNLLANQMDDFNYDDQSTVNSSTNVSLDDYNYAQRYKNASMDDQLKVLYEIRVREVEALSEEVRALKIELVQQKDGFSKKLLLAEAEVDRAQISLRQSQEILVSKTEEISRLYKNFEVQENSTKKLESELQTLIDTNESLKRSNADLIEQLTIMQKGLNTNTVSDRQMQEEYHAEITKLHFNLEGALAKLDRKEKENMELKHQLQLRTQQKDEMMTEKTEIINNLSESVEKAQLQCRELLQLVEQVSQENDTLKKTACDINVINRVQSGLSDKTEIIKVLQKELEKTKESSDKHLIAFDKLQQTFSELNKKYQVTQKEFEELKMQNQHVLSKNEILENNVKMQFEEIKLLNEKIIKYSNVEMEKEILEKRISSLQVILAESENKVKTKEHAIQVSQIMTSFCEQNDLHREEKENLELQISDLKEELVLSQKQVEECMNEISNLQLKISLEQEREEIIMKLQEKANEFERIIKEKQVKPVYNSIGINTDTIIIEDKNGGGEEMLIAKYETELIEKEIKIREELHNEFQIKLDRLLKEKTPQKELKSCINLETQYKELESLLLLKSQEIEKLQNKITEESQIKCQECPILIAHIQTTENNLISQSAELDRFKEQQQEDREMIANILEEWQGKFEQLETKNGQLVEKLKASNSIIEDLQKKLKIRETGDAKLIENIQKEAQNLIKHSNQKALEGIQKLTIEHRNKILESHQKIEKISKKTDKKVQEIESRYKKSRQAIETAFNYK